MTTTELIHLLQAYEHGGIRRKPREISMQINDSLFIPEFSIKNVDTGDGIAGPEICLNIVYEEER